MSKTVHRLFILILVLIVAAILAYVLYIGLSFYQTGISERFFHPDYKMLKPSGILGHGFGIFGSAFMLIGVLIYMLRKRIRTFFRLGQLKYWLEFHIFLCTLGPILVLYHTSFKFGGIVAISFWSMVAVFLSGIIGRFIYIQIPRNMDGRELSLSEINAMKNTDDANLDQFQSLSAESHQEIRNLTQKKIGIYHGNLLTSYFKTYFEDKRTLNRIKGIVKTNKVSPAESKKIIGLAKDELSLNRKIDRLTSMQNLLKYWHVVHLPFAFVMLIVMIIHVVITIMFGSRWLF